jgi:hypothetical protein
VCHTCAPQHLAGQAGRYPRLQPLDPEDVQRARKNPGKPRTRRQLAEDVERPNPFLP